MSNVEMRLMRLIGFSLNHIGTLYYYKLIAADSGAQNTEIHLFK